MIGEAPPTLSRSTTSYFTLTLPPSSNFPNINSQLGLEPVLNRILACHGRALRIEIRDGFVLEHRFFLLVSKRCLPASNKTETDTGLR